MTLSCPIGRMSQIFDPPATSKVIGLTGGIGTGKTEVSKILEGLGAAVINADLLGHKAYRAGTDGWRQVVETFGEEVLAEDGEVDRRRLGQRVFSEPSAMEKLEAIVHPKIREMASQKIDQLRRENAGTIVFEAALLIEAGWDSLVDEVWVTYAPESEVVARLRQSKGLSEGEVRKRIGAQLPLEERAKHGQVVIDNSGTPEALRNTVEAIWNERLKEKDG